MNLVNSKSNISRIAIGYNTNLDLIVPDSINQVLQKFFQKEPSSLKNNGKINSMDNLQETIAYFFSQGSAAERFITDATLFQNLISASTEANDKQFFIGGNAALMAQRLALELQFY